MQYKFLSPQEEGFFLLKEEDENFRFCFSSNDIKAVSELPFSKDSNLLVLFKKDELSKETCFLAFTLLRQLPGNIVEIDYIATNPSYRRQGFGYKCINKIEESLNPSQVWLEVSELNKGAISFYEKRGFVKKSLRKNYYKQGEDAFLYSLNLQKD